MPNYVHRALDIFAGYGDADAISAGDGTLLSYAGLRSHILQLAGTLREHGVRPGSSVAVVVMNPPEAMPLQLALHLLGCRTVWIALITPRRELGEYLAVTHVDTLIYDPRSQQEAGMEVASKLDVPVLCIGPGGAGPDITVPAGEPLAADFEAPSEPESIFQTSGTTGSPKLVHHRQGFFEQVIRLAGEYRASGLPLLRHLSITPPWHVSGPMTGFFNLFHGGVLFIEEAFEAGQFIRTLDAQRINSTFVSPPLFYEMLDNPALAEADLSNLFMFNVGSAPTAPARLRQAYDLLGPAVRIVYGLSESTLISAMPAVTPDPEHPERLSSTGTVYGDVSIEIREEDGRTLVAPGELGEIWVSSALNMTGYWGDPEATAETLVDGWIRTGDIGRLDEHGYLYLVDRAKDMIVTGRGSRNVFSRPIEDLLAAHPKVRAAAVIGVPHEALGEVVHAYVVPAEKLSEAEKDALAEELSAQVLAEFTPIWVPSGYDFADALPLGKTGKVDKKALRAQYAASHP